MIEELKVLADIIQSLSINALFGIAGFGLFKLAYLAIICSSVYMVISRICSCFQRGPKKYVKID